jgi:archaemetzincin
MRRALVLAVLLAAIATPGAASANGRERPAGAGPYPRVCVMPLGPHDRELLRSVKRGIEYLYALEVQIRAPQPLPQSAYYAPRRRYRAEKLLDFLDGAVRPGACDLVIGFTSADISTTKGPHADWGILGLAWVGGPSGVVSTHRLGRRAGPRTRAKRTVKVVNHELGHALGLEHHDRDGCLMEDAGGTVKTVDRESGLLCDESRAELEEKHGFPLPQLPFFNWSRVLD